MFAWGQNRDGQLSVRVQDSLESYVNKPTPVQGLKGRNWPAAIASGNTHSVAVAEAGGVFVCGSAVLGRVSQIIEQNLLNQKRFHQLGILSEITFC